jgi:hypothetical protein
MLVMEALKKDKSHGPMTILVDSESALESVLRVLNKEKRRTEVSRSGDETTVKVEGA